MNIILNKFEIKMESSIGLIRFTTSLVSISLVVWLINAGVII